MDTVEKLKQSASYYPVGLSPVRTINQNEATRKFNRCQCDNCVKERLGLIKLKPGEKRVHVCPFPGCAKLYGKTSHLKVCLVSPPGFKFSSDVRYSLVGPAARTSTTWFCLIEVVLHRITVIFASLQKLYSVTP